MKTYKVTCQVSEDKFHALISYCEALGVTGFSVNLQAALPPSQQSSPTPAIAHAAPHRVPAPPKQKSFHYVGGIRNKGISARDLTLQILNTSPNPVVTCQELRSEFVKHGFAKTSISSPLSELHQEKKIVHVSGAHWALRTRYVAAANGAAPEA